MFDARGIVLLLTQRWQASWGQPAQPEAQTTPQDLIDAARQVLEAQLDATERERVQSTALDGAAQALADGLWNARPERLQAAFDAVGDLLGERDDEAFSIKPAMRDGGADGALDLLRGLRSEWPVPRVSLLFLHGIRAVNAKMRDLAVQDAPSAGTEGSGRTGGLSLQMEEMMHAALTDEALRIRVDIIQQLGRSSEPADKARLAAFWKVYPAMRELADRAVLPAPVFVRKGSDGAEVLDATATLTPPDGLAAREVPAIDEQTPWALFAKFQARQVLDRAAGTLTLEVDGNGGAFKHVIRFAPWTEKDGLAERQRQDAALRLLEDLSLARFNGTRTLPDEIRMEADRIQVESLTIAERTAQGWRLDMPAARQAWSQYNVHTVIGREPKLAAWSLPPRLPAKPPALLQRDRVHVVLQLSSDDPITDDIREQIDVWDGKWGPGVIWIQMDQEGDSRVVHGADLISAIVDGTAVKLTIDGHGVRLRQGSETTTVVDWRSPAELVRSAKEALRRHGIGPRVDRVVIPACELASKASRTSFPRIFLEKAFEGDLVTASATVTSKRDLVLSRGSGRRETAAFVGAPVEHRAPGKTVIHARNADTGEITEHDKYPLGDDKMEADFDRGSSGATSDHSWWDSDSGSDDEMEMDSDSGSRTESGSDGSQDAEELMEVDGWQRRPSDTAEVEIYADRLVRHPGQSGKLFQLFTTLKETLQRLPVDMSQGGEPAPTGPVPRAIYVAIRSRLDALADGLPRGGSELTSAVTHIANGLWSRDPARLYEGYRALSRIFFRSDPRPWAVGDDLTGGIPTVSLPSEILASHPNSLEVAAEDFALMAGVEAGLDAMEDLPAATFDEALRLELGRQTLTMLRAAVSGRPWVVDVDAVTALASSQQAANRAALRMVEVSRATVMRLVHGGSMPRPVYKSQALRNAQDGWTAYADGVHLHRGDPLPGLLLQRKSVMAQLEAPRGTVNDASPLSWLAAFMPQAGQALDRAAGTITITWPELRMGQPVASILKFRPLIDGTDASDAWKRQDLDIQTLDQFIVATFFPYANVPLSTLPVEVRLEGDRLIAGRAVLAERVEGIWTPQRDTILQTQHALDFVNPAGEFPPVDEWDFVPEDASDVTKDASAPPRLRLVLQMEPEARSRDRALRIIAEEPTEVVWIQADRYGHRIRYGAHLLEQATPQTSFKLEVLGDGTHDYLTRTQRLSGYTAEALVDRLATLKDGLALKVAASHATLFAGKLETPAVLSSYGTEFHDLALQKGVLSPGSKVTSYSETLYTAPSWHGRMSRWTEQYPGAPWRMHVPGVTYSRHKDPVSGKTVMVDKYPWAEGAETRVQEGLEVESVRVASTADRGASGTTDSAPPHQEPQAGKLSELFSALTRYLGQAGIAPLEALAPNGWIDAVLDDLMRSLGPKATQSMQQAYAAASQIADGVWQLNPAKILDGYRKVAALHGDALLKVSWDDRPNGLVEAVRFPSLMLAGFRKAVLAPAGEIGLLRGLKAVGDAIARAPRQTSSAALRKALAGQTAELVGALLSGRPFVIDADKLKGLSTASRTAEDHDATGAIRVLEAVHATAMQLARQGVMAAPIFMTDAESPVGDGWERQGDGSHLHRGDLLPELLPGRAKEIEAVRARFVDDIDPAKPLRRLAGHFPQATQTLTRETGTITIRWPEGKQADTVLRFRSLAADAAPELRTQQDADIRALDEFIIGAFFGSHLPARNSMPDRLTLLDGILTAGEAVLARRAGDRWLPDQRILRQLRMHLGSDAGRSTMPAKDWQSGLGDALKGKEGQGRVFGGRLRVHLQIGDHEEIVGRVRQAVRQDPHEVVWIQMDRFGGHQIRYGEHLLSQLGADQPVQITIEGRVAHDRATRSQVFSGFTAMELADRLASVVTELGLASRINEALLRGSGLVAPFVKTDYAAAFLEAAVRKGAFHDDVSLTAQAKDVGRGIDLTQDRRGHPETGRHQDAPSRADAPSVTRLYKIDVVTKKATRTDSHSPASSVTLGIHDFRTIGPDGSGGVWLGRPGAFSELSRR